MSTATEARDKTYNGWANWQTWNVALWLGNDEGLYNEARSNRRTNGRLNAADAQRFVMDVLPEGTPDMNGCKEYTGVRWGEIARCINEF